MRAVSYVALAAAALAFAPPTRGQDPASRSARVDSLFAAWSGEGEPGCAVTVVERGVEVHRGLHGTAVVEHGVPIDGATMFDLASLSKHFTAAAAALLVADGLLTWDDPLRRWIPELPGVYEPVRLRHLVHHTSGVRGYFALWALAGRDIESAVEDEEVMAMLARQARLDFAPGEREVYSNSNYFLLAEIVERASGRSLDSILRERLFDPLGMTSARFVDDHEDILPGLAGSYFTRAGGALARRVLKHDVLGPSGLHASIDDMARWAIGLLSASGPGADLLPVLATPGALVDGSRISYAGGLRAMPLRGVPTLSHGGTMGGFRTYMVLVPDAAWGTVVLCNRLETRPFQLTRAIAEVWFEERMTPAGTRDDSIGRPAPPATEDPEPEGVVGRYRSEELAASFEIVRTVAGLGVRRGDLPAEPVAIVGPDRLASGGVRATIERGGDGRVARIVLDTERAAGIVLRPVEATAAVTSVAPPGLDWPSGVAVDRAGNVFVAERRGNRVWRLDAARGEWKVFAGTGVRGFGGDGGPADRAILSLPELIALDGDGNLYLTDRGNARVRRVDARTGIITTVAGTGNPGYSGDGGPATEADLSYPFGVFVDGSGSVYVADTENHVVRRIDGRTGVIETVAGNGEEGFSGDGGPAVQARLRRPHVVVVDPAGDLVIGDSGNQRIRRVDRRTGRIETLYGTGAEGAGPDGIPARESPFAYFGSLVYEPSGDLLLSGWVDGRIRRIDARSGIVTTIARVPSPYGMALDGEGGLIVAEAEAGRLVRVDPATGTVTPIGGEDPP